MDEVTEPIGTPPPIGASGVPPYTGPPIPRYPVVEIAGAEAWIEGHEKGGEMDALWPGQEADDFCMALSYNLPGPLTGDAKVAGLLCVQRGDNDGPPWVWLVTVEGGPNPGDWWAWAWCDYTGWDCQGDLVWSMWENPPALEAER